MPLFSRFKEFYVCSANSRGALTPSNVHRTFSVRLIRFTLGGEHTKNTAFAFVHTGVWHNPRIKKQKQYIPKYALTHCQSNSLFISCQTYVCTDWFVSNNMLCSRVRNNQPLLIACKSIKIFQHIQIFMKKNSFFVHLW